MVSVRSRRRRSGRVIVSVVCRGHHSCKVNLKLNQEYVGELVDDGVVHRCVPYSPFAYAKRSRPYFVRDIIRRYSGLNYVGRSSVRCPSLEYVFSQCFGVLGTTIDSHWFGNPTRFLNDSKPGPPNCAAVGA